MPAISTPPPLISLDFNLASLDANPEHLAVYAVPCDRAVNVYVAVLVFWDLVESGTLTGKMGSQCVGDSDGINPPRCPTRGHGWDM